ncbi:hypothetical protein O997_03285 [Anaplasma phagocytophilum str. MRK]|nr:hypothetical protein O997_03285 [Anaplasma phagocytophilum str. MRK]
MILMHWLDSNVIESANFDFINGYHLVVKLSVIPTNMSITVLKVGSLSHALYTIAVFIPVV